MANTVLNGRVAALPRLFTNDRGCNSVSKSIVINQKFIMGSPKNLFFGVIFAIIRQIMDPQQPSSTGHEIPASSQQGDMLPDGNSQEVSLNSRETAPHQAAPSSGIPPVPPPVATFAVQTPLSQVSGMSASTSSASPTVAEDLDLIEKEWVEKAKSIVASTRTDPYAQNQELNRFKADYMQKRYNKDIKIEP